MQNSKILNSSSSLGRKLFIKKFQPFGTTCSYNNSNKSTSLLQQQYQQEQTLNFSSSKCTLRKKNFSEKNITTIIKVKYDPRKDATPRKHIIEGKFHQDHAEKTQESIQQFNQVLSQVDVDRITKEYLTQLKEREEFIKNYREKIVKKLSEEENLFFSNMMDMEYMKKAKTFLKDLGIEEIPIEQFVKAMTHISFVPPSADTMQNPSVLGQCNDEYQPMGGQLFTTLCNKFMYMFLRYREFKNNSSEKNLRWFLEDALNIEKRGSEFEIQFNYFNRLRNDVLHHVSKEIGLTDFVLFDTNRLTIEAPPLSNIEVDEPLDPEAKQYIKPKEAVPVGYQLEVMSNASAVRSLLYLIEHHYNFDKVSTVFEQFMIPKLAEYIQKETTVLREDVHYPQLLQTYLDKHTEMKDKFYLEYRFITQFIDEDNKKRVQVGLFVNDQQWGSELAPNFTEAKFILAKKYYDLFTTNPVMLRKLVEQLANVNYIYSLEKLTGARDQKKK